MVLTSSARSIHKIYKKFMERHTILMMLINNTEIIDDPMVNIVTYMYTVPGRMVQ